MGTPDEANPLKQHFISAVLTQFLKNETGIEPQFTFAVTRKKRIASQINPIVMKR